MQILGIFLDKPFLRVALIEKRRGKSKIIYLNSHPYSESENVKQLYTKAFKGKIASALHSGNVLIRPVMVNIGKSKYLDQALLFQREASHFSEKDKTVSAPYILKNTKDQTSALIFTTSKEALEAHLETLERLSIDPDQVATASLALANYFNWKAPDLKDAYLIDLGSEEWTCICIDDGVLKKVHSIQGGIEELLEALWEDRKKALFPKEIPGIAKQLDLTQLKEQLNPQIYSCLEEKKQELGRVLCSFYTAHGKKPLYFTGRTDSFGQIEEYLKQSNEEFFDPPTSIDLPKGEKKYAIPIGLAVGFEENGLQFRKGEFFPKKTWRALGKGALYLTMASLAIGGSLVAISNYALSSKAKKMVSLLETSLSKWDQDLSRKIFTSDDEEEILSKWDRSVATHLKLPTYMGQYPKVSEVLSWIYSHPLVQEKTDPIKIKSFHYQMISYPKIDSPKDGYQAKLELEFETKSPLNARKFHEEIHDGKAYVDNKEDLQWDLIENTYRTSFYLKKEKAS